VPATDVEETVTRALVAHLAGAEESAPDVEAHRHNVGARIARVEVRKNTLAVFLKRPDADGRTSLGEEGDRSLAVPNDVPDDAVLQIPWRKPPSKKSRTIMLPASVSGHAVRPIRAERRTALIKSIARGRAWLEEMVTDPITNVADIAARHRCSVRQVNMTITMAFLAPGLVRAAIEGRLPRGVGVAALRDAPAEWSFQLQRLGLGEQPHA
jgi:hypothetical protein